MIKQNSQHNEFELSLRFLGNELIAIKSLQLTLVQNLLYGVYYLIFSFMILEVFGLMYVGLWIMRTQSKKPKGRRLQQWVVIY